ncbi:hypothetical protein L1049_018739 [Liquidambar formosana]|uniref:MATH domain-containing protein n=1 Tax=Liquidambar formosana TaxID=63359 RepID=A0AAP0RAH1_LIQFO
MWSLKMEDNYNEAEGKGLSIYLRLDDWTSRPAKQKLYAEFRLRVRDQVRSNHRELTVKQWFSSSNTRGWGFHALVALSDLNQDSKGFIKDDTLIVEAQIIVMSVVKHLS